MSNSISKALATDSGHLRTDTLDGDDALRLEGVQSLSDYDLSSAIITSALQPWSIESDETATTDLRLSLSEEFTFLGKMSMGNLAWSVAELVVAREAEVMEFGAVGAREGLLKLGHLAYLYEHLFIAQSGNALNADTN